MFFKKNLNTKSIRKSSMQRGASSRLKGAELDKAIKEAQKDPEFMREIDKFIKATTN